MLAHIVSLQMRFLGAAKNRHCDPDPERSEGEESTNLWENALNLWILRLLSQAQNDESILF